MRKPYNYQEFTYIEKTPEDKLKEYRKAKLIGIDPGKSDLIFCTDGQIDLIEKNDKTYRKTNTFTYSHG